MGINIEYLVKEAILLKLRESLVSALMLRRYMDKKTKANYQFVYDAQDQKTGVIIKYKEYQKILEKLEDLQDIHTVRKLKGKKLKTVPLEQVMKEIFGSN